MQGKYNDIHRVSYIHLLFKNVVDTKDEFLNTFIHKWNSLANETEMHLPVL